MVVRKTSALKKRIGDILVEVGIITQDQLREALDIQKSRGGKLGQILKDLGYCSEDVLMAFLGRQCGVSYVSLAEYDDIPSSVIALVPEPVARRQILIPIKRESNVLTIAMSDPLNVFATDDLRLQTGCEIQVVIASGEEIRQAIDRYYMSSPKSANGGKAPQHVPAPASEPSSMEEILGAIDNAGGAEETDLEHVTESKENVDVITLSNEAGQGPVIKMVNMVISNAVKVRASDIHIEPFERMIRVRYRLDGVLHNQPAPPKKYQNAVVSRIKIMSQLDIAERRLPQDGRIKVRVDSREITLRVSLIPTPYGEKVVMRILDSSGLKVNLDQLGFEEDTMKKYMKLIEAPYGIILVTGPTGSGKSTTLYSSLAVLNNPDTNIMTIEDPVEYMLEGINQVQARPDIGLTFATGLRSFLRQDPDIILVGEIRDTETADISINAALTGHLVFSTLHTNDAPAAVTRLTNMGIEPFLTASTVIGVIGQRLMRVICNECKKPEPVAADLILSHGPSAEQIKALSKSKTVNIYKGKGCDACANTGYAGRVAIHELLTMTDPIRELILERASQIKIKKVARKDGMRTMREVAMNKLLAGVTTLEEVLRVTQSDSDVDAGAE